MKATVPFFNETIDLTDPADAGGKFVGMAAGAAVAIGAGVLAQRAVNVGREAATGDDDGVEVL